MQADFIHVLYEDVFRFLEIDHWEEKRKRETLDRLARVLADRIFLRVADRIPEDKRGELAKLFTHPDYTDEARFAFLNNHIPDFLSFLQKEIGRFRDDLNSLK